MRLIPVTDAQVIYNNQQKKVFALFENILKIKNINYI